MDWDGPFILKNSVQTFLRTNKYHVHHVCFCLPSVCFITKVSHLIPFMLLCFILVMLFLCILIFPVMNTPAYVNKQISQNITMETEFR